MKSFSEHQESLLKKGMVVLTDCSNAEAGSFGGIIFNQVIENPSGDLLATMRENVLEALSDKFQKHHQFFHGQKPDDKYLEKLLSEFEEEQTNPWLRSNFTELEWIDNDNPMAGILFKARENISSYFELWVRGDRLKQVWANELNIEVDPKIDKRMQIAIDEALEEMAIDFDLDCPHELDEMVGLNYMLYQSCPKEKKRTEIESGYFTHLFSPLFDNYKNHFLYIATPDTTYIAANRAGFYPVIAGERLDGSHEVTIFEGTNT